MAFSNDDCIEILNAVQQFVEEMKNARLSVILYNAITSSDSPAIQLLNFVEVLEAHMKFDNRGSIADSLHRINSLDHAGADFEDAFLVVGDVGRMFDRPRQSSLATLFRSDPFPPDLMEKLSEFITELRIELKLVIDGPDMGGPTMEGF